MSEFVLLRAVIEDDRAGALAAIARRDGLNQTDSEGLTPLMLTDDEAVADALLAAGAIPDARDLEGMTALMHSSRWGKNLSVTAALLNAGACIDAVDSRGETALSKAITTKQTAVAICCC
jgi:ankyrin repeat protein